MGNTKSLTIAIIALVFIYPIIGFAQVLPKNGDTINFTSVLFSFPWDEGVDNYIIELEEQGLRPVKYLYDFNANKGVVDRLGFGKQYHWRYAPVQDNKPGDWSDTFVFTIGKSRYTDTTYYKYKGRAAHRGTVDPGVLFLDYGRVAVNRAGVPQYYLPEFDFIDGKSQIRDLKMTRDGTLTALLDGQACEFTLDGEILWQAPDDGKINGEESEFYHHEFTKLSNGNYLVLGNDHVQRITPEAQEVEVEFGTIIEYAPNGGIVWSWNSKDYFTDEDLFSKRGRGGRYELTTHMNACKTNGDYLFAGFRDISRIIVIEKSTGKVISSYGGYGFPTEKHSGTGFFRRQHDATLLSDGNFAVINNDSVMDPSIVSSLVIFSPMTDKIPSSEKIFEFRFDFDTLTNGKSVKTGNLQELENGHLFINMGSLNRCVEINREGDVLWSMFMNYYDTNHRMVLPFPQYRVSYVSSLYPYITTARIISDKKINNNRKTTVRIFNVGSESNTYLINVRNGKKTNSVSKGIAILPGESKDVELLQNSYESAEIEVQGEKGGESVFLKLNKLN